MPVGKSKLKRRSVHLMRIGQIAPIKRIGAILTLISAGWLREAEPVSGIVFEDRFDAVRPLGGFGQKLHALRLQLFVSSTAVVSVEDTRAEHSLSHDRAQRL